MKKLWPFLVGMIALLILTALFLPWRLPIAGGVYKSQTSGQMTLHASTGNTFWDHQYIRFRLEFQNQPDLHIELDNRWNCFAREGKIQWQNETVLATLPCQGGESQLTWRYNTRTHFWETSLQPAKKQP